MVHFYLKIFKSDDSGQGNKLELNEIELPNYLIAEENTLEEARHDSLFNVSQRCYTQKRILRQRSKQHFGANRTLSLMTLLLRPN